jgi:amino acid adenylation domain-containing protein
MAGTKRVHEMFSDVVERLPNAPALLMDNDRLTFKQLLMRARNVQYALRAHHGKNSLVALFMERSFAFFEGLFGVLLSGLGYVPVSTRYGEERIRYIVQFSKPVALLTYEPFATQVRPAYDGELLDMLALNEAPRSDPMFSKILGATAGTDMAYVIFTSGTTGRPKGVMIEHHSVCNLVVAKKEVMKYNEKDRVLQFFDVAFDGSVFDIFPTLCAGLALILWKGGLDAAEAANNRHRGNVAFFTNSSLEMISSFPPSMNIIGQAGEACSPLLVEKWSKQCRFMNLYGPTEATVWTTWKDLKGGETVTIGTGVPGCGVELLEETHEGSGKFERVKQGQVGEICCAGAGLARGYLYDEGKTKDKFVQTRYGRVYRSGDLGTFDEHGDLHFRGRMDDQVKISGVRIELQEVENVLQEQPTVHSACCIVNDGKILAFAVAAAIGGGSAIDLPSELIKVAKDNLPTAAVPSAIVLLKEMPLTAHGKVDKAKLAAAIEVDMSGELKEIDRVCKEHQLVRGAASIISMGKVLTFLTLKHECPTIKEDMMALMKLKLPQNAVPSEIVLLEKMPLMTEMASFYSAERRYFTKKSLHTLVDCRIEGKVYVACIHLRCLTHGYSHGSWVDEFWWDPSGKRCSSYHFVPDEPFTAERLASYHKHKEIHYELDRWQLQPGFLPFNPPA